MFCIKRLKSALTFFRPKRRSSRSQSLGRAGRRSNSSENNETYYALKVLTMHDVVRLKQVSLSRDIDTDTG